MPHPLRFFWPGVLYEISARTIQERFLLRPGPAANEIILGVLGRALDRFPAVNLHAFAFMSDHYHSIASTDEPAMISEFEGYVNGHLARELGRLHGWRGRFWAKRYSATPILDDESSVQRLRYLLAQGTKEGLVASPHDAPWVSALPALLGRPLEGVWFSRNREYEARRAKRQPGRYDHATRYPVRIAPLPCWAHLTEDERIQRVEELVRAIEDDARTERKGRRVLGAAKILAAHPHQSAVDPKRTPTPLCHTSSTERRVAFKRLSRWLRDEFQSATAKLASWERSGRASKAPEFPAGTFPPGLPFVKPPAGQSLPLELDPFAASIEGLAPIPSSGADWTTPRDGPPDVASAVSGVASG